MGVLVNPAASSALRIAATRPSIMSLGATISAPARACDTAAFASHSSVGSFSHFAIDHQPAVAVAGVLAIAHVRHDEQLGNFALERPDGLLHDSVARRKRPMPISSLVSGIPNRMTPPMPSE